MASIYKVAFLDVDGTLGLSEQRNQRAITDAALLGGYEIQPCDWDTLAGNNDGVIWERLVEKQPSLRNTFATACAFEAACLAAKLCRIGEVEIIVETREAVDLFRRNAMLLAPVSNSITADASATLTRVGYDIDNDFAFFLFRDKQRELGLRAKPHPDPYLEAFRRAAEILETATLNPIECLILEDSRTGARAGLQAGMTVIHLTDECPALDTDEVENYKSAHGGAYFPVKRAGLMDLLVGHGLQP